MRVGQELEQARQRAAAQARDRFDFGGAVQGSEGWVEDMRDALSCQVHLKPAARGRSLTFRVVFRPGSDGVRDIEVGERLPLA